MKNRPFDFFVFSTLGIVVCLVVVVFANVVASFKKVRIDFTAEGLFTLSEGTRQILEELDTQVQIRFYATRDDRIMPPHLKTYIGRVEDLLSELVEKSNGFVAVQKLDPEPDSDAADSAVLDQMTPLQTPTDTIYLGLAVSFLQKTVSVPYLDPNREVHLEYDLIRAITQVIAEDKPVIGVISSVPIMGEAPNPMMMRMGRQPQGPWFVIQQLHADFDVREINVTTESIDEEVDVLLIVHPQDLGDQTLYAVDQFLLQGGKLLTLMDPVALFDVPPNQMGQSPPTPSDLEKLLSAWGLEFHADKVLADMTFAKEVSLVANQPQTINPSVPFVSTTGIKQGEVVTDLLDEVLFVLPGSFSGDPVEGLEKTVLLHSSEQSSLVSSLFALHSNQQIVDKFKAEGIERPYALRLTGTFPTAFPDGRPQSEDEEDIDRPEETEEEGAEEGTETPAEESLTESAEPGMVVLIGDVDFIYDAFCIQVQNIFGQQLVQKRHNNVDLFQNLVEYLVGDNRLIQVRSRATMNRPFLVIQKMRAEAMERHREEEAELKEELQEAINRINELQQQRVFGQDQQNLSVLSSEQKEELSKYNEQRAEISQKLKQVRRNLRKDIDSLENWLKLANIAAVPVLIAFIGIFTVIVKRNRTAAR